MKIVHQNPQEVLGKTKRIVLIGCSPDPYRTSNYAAKFLMQRGYEVIPVNPNEEVILGEKCYPDLNSIPKNVLVDIVNIFRKSIHTEGVVDEVIEWNKKTGQKPVIWTQLDVSSPQAELKAKNADLPYIRNLCIMVELDRMN
ncbi:MAG: CoA-binding protein [Balneolaceae bacterium]